MTRSFALVLAACSARATTPLTNAQPADEPAREYTAVLRGAFESNGAAEGVEIRFLENGATWIIDDHTRAPWFELEGFVVVRGTCYEVAGATHFRVESMRPTVRDDEYRFRRIGPERVLRGHFVEGGFVAGDTKYRLVDNSEVGGAGPVAVVAREFEPNPERVKGGPWLWVISVHPYDHQPSVPPAVPCPPIPSG